jgi:hypothetical protein
MAFENEYASYEPLRRLMESPKVQNLQKRLRVRKNDEVADEDFTNLVIGTDQIVKSEWVPDMILAIDGGYQPVRAENGYPGAEFGYVTVASVLILLDKIRKLERNDFIDPKKFRETEKASTVDSVFPGCNVIIDNEKSARASMRKALFEELKSNSIFSDGETLLDTYEHLLKIKLERDKKEGVSQKPSSPIEDVDKEMTYNFGQYQCPHSGLPLYSTDALRLHELLNPGGTCGEMYGQIMSMLEKLWLIHILRAFEQKEGWLPTLRRVAFILDGPLACFSTWSWLNKSIVTELRRINEKQKEINKKDLLIIGIEKSGTFCNHFEDLDTSKEGVKDKLPPQSAFLLSDSYIKQNIIFTESNKQYGQDTYFGRKFFYKTLNNYKLVPVIACFNDYQQDLETANPDQFPRLADLMNILDQLVSSKYPNSVSALVSAHAEASIPLNLGKKIFEEIAKEIREKD